MKNQKKLLNKLLFCSAAIGFLGVFVFSTNPNNITLPLLVVPFLLAGFIAYQLTAAALLWKSVGQKTFLSQSIPLTISFAVVSLMLLQSLHQLTWKDSLLVCVFTVLFWLYILRADFLQK